MHSLKRKTGRFAGLLAGQISSCSDSCAQLVHLSSTSAATAGAGIASGPPRKTAPRSTLGNVEFDFVFAQNPAAREQLREAARESIQERLSLVLGRRKGRRLEVEALQRLQAEELAAACAQARLPAAALRDAPAMAAALHAFLYPHAPDQPPEPHTTPVESAAAAAAGAAAGGRRRGPAGPTAFQPASWDSFGADSGRAGAAAAAAVNKGRGLAEVIELEAEEDEEQEAEQEAAARRAAEAAEAAAESLLEGELGRRLSALASGGGGASSSSSGAGGAGPPSHPARRSPLFPQAAGHPSGAAPQPGRLSEAGAVREEEEEVWGRGVVPPLVSAAARATAAASPPARAPGHAPALPPARHGAEVAAVTEEAAEEDADAEAEAEAQAVAGARRKAEGPLPLPPLPPGSRSGPVSEYAPLPSPHALPPAAEVLRAVRRALSRRGYPGKDPRQLRSVLLLSRPQLLDLLADFNALPGGGTGAGLSREQLAAALLQLTAPGTEAAAATAAAAVSSGVGGSSGTAGSSTSTSSSNTLALEGPSQQLRVVEDVERDGEQQQRQQQVERQQEQQQQEQAAWDEEAAAFGDPRRREVLAAARRRLLLLERAAVPEEIATWLVKARAQDVLLFSLPSPAGAATHAVLATALSQRHAYAAAHAVRYQIKDKLDALVAAEEEAAASPAHSASPAAAAGGGARGSAAAAAAAAVPGAPAVAGVNGSDWLSLEAGSVQVHVLTAPARQYYRLEELFGAEEEEEGGWAGAGALRRRGGRRQPPPPATAAGAAADPSLGSPQSQRWRDPQGQQEQQGQEMGLEVVEGRLTESLRVGDVDAAAAREDGGPPASRRGGGAAGRLQRAAAAQAGGPPAAARRPRVQLFGPGAAGEALLDTLETAQVHPEERGGQSGEEARR
ncbi:hypothetical protein HXX76_012719 [Chlamydomonas incerta]|uniref:Uncharacterized protein n=1 Tax=Chlamydomonas incerta TaxID=51695 RepID=A0A835SNQ9_CHLIN|nr:hypothetical protein HXX76_012719 [Chlamydomonas incerta]|eukprot:KAG2426933.1 hypothetical protein HXX76_012719 [Chlamydomonas incerta]